MKKRKLNDRRHKTRYKDKRRDAKKDKQQQIRIFLLNLFFFFFKPSSDISHTYCRIEAFQQMKNKQKQKKQTNERRDN